MRTDVDTSHTAIIDNRNWVELTPYERTTIILLTRIANHLVANTKDYISAKEAYENQRIIR